MLVTWNDSIMAGPSLVHGIPLPGPQRLARLDRDHDGVVTAHELLTACSDPEVRKALQWTFPDTCLEDVCLGVVWRMCVLEGCKHDFIVMFVYSHVYGDVYGHGIAHHLLRLRA